MRPVAALLLFAAACGDPTGVGELGLHEGASYDLAYAAVVHYDCADHEPSGNVFPLPLPPADPEICGDATDTVLARYDTVTAAIRIIGRVDDCRPLFPNAEEFEADAEHRYRVCSVRPALPCADQAAIARAVLSRHVAPCGPSGLPDEYVQYEVILGPFDVESACARTAADSIGVVLILIGVLEGGGSFLGIGFEIDGAVEGLHSLWIGTLPSRTDPDGQGEFTAFINLRELRTESWVLEPL